MNTQTTNKLYSYVNNSLIPDHITKNVEINIFRNYEDKTYSYFAQINDKNSSKIDKVLYLPFYPNKDDDRTFEELHQSILNSYLNHLGTASRNMLFPKHDNKYILQITTDKTLIDLLDDYGLMTKIPFYSIVNGKFYSNRNKLNVIGKLISKITNTKKERYIDPSIIHVDR